MLDSESSEGVALACKQAVDVNIVHRMSDVCGSMSAEESRADP